MITFLKQSKHVRLLAKILLTLATFWLVLRHTDMTSLRSMLHRQDHVWIFGTIILMLIQIMIGSKRWQLIISTIAQGTQSVVTFTESLKICYVGNFFNCCLPGTVGGDVIRVWLAKSDRLPLPLAIHSVIIDRLIALMALGVLVAATLPLWGKIMGFDALSLLPAIAALAIAGFWVLIHMDQLLKKWQHIRPVAWLLYFTGSLLLLFKHRASSLISLGFALITHLSLCLCGYALAHSFGTPITLLQCITLIPPVLLLMTLPISIGGWGVREAGMVTMLKLAGVPQEAALILSVQLGLIGVLVSLPGGLVWMGYRRQSGQPQIKEAA